jgi:DNA sulfur modification protein DndC
MREAAAEQQMPIVPHKLMPEAKTSFWVNLIGRGYPAPRKLFRWCTERLKIDPSNRFIRDVVRENGEAILVLGTRKAESQRRARTMAKHDKRRVRERLTPNANLPNSLVYTPIEDWSNDDVWLFLMQYKNPWGHTNTTAPCPAPIPKNGASIG